MELGSTELGLFFIFSLAGGLYFSFFFSPALGFITLLCFYSYCLLHESDVIPFPFFNFIFGTFLFMTCKLINFRIVKSVLYLLAFYLMY